MATDITTANPQPPPNPNPNGTAPVTPDSMFGVTPGQAAAGAAAYTSQYVNATSPSLNSNTLAPQNPIQLPPSPTDTTNYNGMITGGNTQNNLLQQYLASQTPPPSSSDQYNTDYKNAGIDNLQANSNTDLAGVKSAQDELATVNAKIQGLTAESDAAKLNKEGAGQGAPSFVVSADQAAVDKATALKALPLQAQAVAAQAKVAAAQGQATLSENLLKQAQDHLDKVYQIHAEDAKSQYQYKTDQLKAVYDYATNAEKEKITAQQKLDDQAFTTQQNNLNQAQTFANTAIQNGQGDIAAKLMALDPKNASYAQNIATLAGQIKAKPTAEQLSQSAIANSTAQLVKAKGADGYTDPNLYARLRSQSSLSPTDFDNRFAYLVNPQSYGNLGLTKTQGAAPTQFSATDQQALVGSGITSTDIPQIQNYVNQYGLDAFFKNNPNMSGTQKDALNKVYGR